MGEMVLALWQQAYINKRRYNTMPKTKSSVAAATTKSTSVANRELNIEAILQMAYVGNAQTICKIRTSNGAPRTVRNENDELPAAISSWRIVWGEAPEQRVTVAAAAAQLGLKTVGGMLVVAEKAAGIKIPRGANTVIYCN